MEAYEENGVVLHILWHRRPEADRELPSKNLSVPGTAKSDKMELIIQKAVELGVYQVIPVATKRCVVKLDAKKAAKKQNAGSRSQKVRQSSPSGMLIPEVACDDFQKH